MIVTAFWKSGDGGIAPVITKNITSSIVPTTPVTLTITTIGDTPTYTWKKDNVVITGETGTSIIINTGGTYTVDVTNGSGTVTGGPAIITVSAEPFYYLNFVFLNKSHCNLSRVESQILGYQDISDPNAIMNADTFFSYNTTTYNSTYQIGSTVFSKEFRDNCVSEVYSGDNTLVTNTSRYYYNAEYNEEINDWQCKSPPEYGIQNRSVSLGNLAASIKIQYDADNTKGLSSGNPFVYTISDS